LVKEFSSLGCEAKKDEVNNVFATIKASSGNEKLPKICLQGHSDMVPSTRDGFNHN
jgi:di/tripeptidase